MGHYKSNLRDIEFNLFEMLGRQSVLGAGPYLDVDADTARDILREVDRLAREELAASLLSSDREPPSYDPQTHEVRLPDDFKASYRAYLDAEWWRMDIPAELGGIVVPPSLRWAVQELVLGANPAVHIYGSGFSFAKLLDLLGTPDQRRLAELMVDRKWGATMVLTEPDAGSDVGAGRTRAVPQDDGTWHLLGVKRFITSAEHDLSENIVHLVLARPEGAGPGTKGLSLFVVPKHHIDLTTGALTGRNGAFVTNLEHKMGLRVSTTCELRFGEVDDIPAVGTLLGGAHEGIAQMFRIIEFARMMVGTKAIATLSSGYLNALEFAKERVQGPDLTRQADKTAPRVAIIRHPDVRRSLMTQKAYAEGLRALVLYTASIQDTVELAMRSASHDESAERLNDLLLPLVKGCGSERSWVLLGTECLQTLGGSGYLQDYPLEQYVRDAKIDTLYEGTTAIQALDFFFRKIVRDRGAAFAHLAGLVLQVVKGEPGDDRLAGERALLGTALDDVQAIVSTMVQHAVAADSGRRDADPRQIYPVGLNATRLLMASGDLVIGWLLLRQAEVALARLEDGARLAPAERNFYTGKLAAARFFAREVLPRLTVERQLAEATDNSLMDLDESAF